MNAAPEPGWYEDPFDAGAVRWWDGAHWSGATRRQQDSPRSSWSQGIEAVSAGMRRLVERRSSFAAVSAIGVAAVVVAYFGTAIGVGLVGEYNFFTEAPPTASAQTVTDVGFLIFFLVVSVLVATVFSWLCLVADGPLSVGLALRRAGRRTLRDVWWACPATIAAGVALLLVIVAPPVVAVVVGVSANRSREEPVSRPVRRAFGAHLMVAMLATSLAVVFWLSAYVMSWFVTPHVAVDFVLVAVVAAGVAGVMALTATSAVALHDGLGTGAAWAPPVTLDRLVSLSAPAGRPEQPLVPAGSFASTVVPMTLPIRWRRTRNVALVMMIAGIVGTIGPSVAANGICGVVPCAPGGPEIGLHRSEPDRSEPDRSEPDRSDPDRSDPDRSDPDRSDFEGVVVGEIGSRSGGEVLNLWIDDADGNVVWKVQRAVPAAFDGSFVLGRDVAGFATVVSLTGPVPADGYVNADNGCSLVWAPLRTDLASNRLTDSFGDDYSAEDFRSFDSGFDSCTSAVGTIGRIIEVGGIILFVLGLALLITALTRTKVPAALEPLRSLTSDRIQRQPSVVLECGHGRRRASRRGDCWIARCRCLVRTRLRQPGEGRRSARIRP